MSIPTVGAPIRIGILGAAKIAPTAIVEPAKTNPDVVVQSVAARSPTRAEIFAKMHDIAHIAQDYASLIARDDVDLVYIPLPPAEHLHWTKEALNSGKHVLCEKPFAMDARQAAEMVETAKACDRHLIEAFHYRFHPLIAMVKELMEELGTIKHINAKFCVPIPNRDDELRYIPELGGGALMDLGCYPLHLCRTLVGLEPEISAAQAQWHKTGVDQGISANLAFPSGVSANISCTMKMLQKPKILAEIRGEHGRLQIRNFVAPHMFHTLKLETTKRRWKGKVNAMSTYAHQLEHVVKVLRGMERPITGGRDAIATMTAIDAIYALARKHGPKVPA